MRALIRTVVVINANLFAFENLWVLARRTSNRSMTFPSAFSIRPYDIANWTAEVVVWIFSLSYVHFHIWLAAIWYTAFVFNAVFIHTALDAVTIGVYAAIANTFGPFTRPAG